MNEPAIPGLRFRHILAAALKPGDIMSIPGGWATVTARTGVDADGDGDGETYVTVTVTLMVGAVSTFRLDAGSVVPILRPDPAMPAPGTRVRTPFGLGSVVQPDGVVVVCYDTPAPQPPVKFGLVPAGQVTPIKNGTAPR